MIKFIHKNSGSDNLVIFIHGFTGDDSTWVNSHGQSLPTLLLREQRLKNGFDFAYLSYYTKLIDFKDSRHAARLLGKIFGRGTSVIPKNINILELAEYVRSIINYSCTQYENLIFVSHSMGGLISKAYILKELNQPNPKVKLFLSLAVPHKGSNWATIGQTILDNPQIFDLNPLGTTVNELNQEWIKNSGLIPKTIYFYGLYDDVVPKTSAISYEVEDTLFVACDADHFSIAKPESVNSISVNALRTHLLEYLDGYQREAAMEIREFTDQGQLDSELFAVKLIIANVHEVLTRRAKEAFYNAEYMRKLLSPKDLKKLQELYIKIELLYTTAFGRLLSGEIKDSSHLVTEVHQKILDEDRAFLSSSIPFISAYQKTGMLHQQANRLDRDIWWAQNNGLKDIEEFRRARGL